MADMINRYLDDIKAYIAQNEISDIRRLFKLNKDRFAEFSREGEDLLFDFSKVPVDSWVLKQLLKIAQLRGVETCRTAMFNGEKINNTENRAALHVALRGANSPYAGQIKKVLGQLEDVSAAIHQGIYKGSTGQPIKNIVNIGIGGSDLGPRMVVRALQPYQQSLNSYFVSNIDSADIADCLKKLNPENTLFIVTSKSFTTIETLENARYAKLWLENRLGGDVKQHFIAITSAKNKAIEFGIKEENCFEFWDWVGGRFSLWGPVGLPIMLSLGCDNFRQLLAGAHNMDQHFLSTPMIDNIPILFALLNYYYRLCCRYNNVAIVPYAQRLEYLPAYLQQLLMESNGKGVSRGGQLLGGPTGALIWGDVGTNAQHAFFQFLHQSTEITPVEFIGFAENFENCEQAKKQHRILLANCLAQSEALLEGAVNSTESYKYFSGNRPSITILLKKLSPYQLGQILALYEHRTFIEGVLFDINSFDQWGVELGKKMAKNMQQKNNNLAAETLYSKELLKFLRKYNHNL